MQIELVYIQNLYLKLFTRDMIGNNPQIADGWDLPGLTNWLGPATVATPGTRPHPGPRNDEGICPPKIKFQLSGQISQIHVFVGSAVWHHLPYSLSFHLTEEHYLHLKFSNVFQSFCWFPNIFIFPARFPARFQRSSK